MNGLGALWTGMLLAYPPGVSTAPVAPGHCMAASTKADGAYVYTPITVDLDSGTPLDPEALPERTSAVMCPRPTLVPTAGDHRVLSEWGVSFGLRADDGRVLWLWARAARLRTRVDGKLNAAEKKAARQWLDHANAAYAQALQAAESAEDGTP